jgi:hypothetical protein
LRSWKQKGATHNQYPECYGTLEHAKGEEMKPIPHPLTVRALKLFGPSTRNAAHWLRAVRYLRARNLWLLDKEILRKGQQERNAA